MTLAALLVTIAVVALSGCASERATPTTLPTATPIPTPTPASLAPKIEGKWRIVNGQATLRFYGGQRSGVVVRVIPDVFGPTTTEGTFQWVDATSVRLVFPALFGTDSTIFATAFASDRMRLVPPIGATLEYQRVGE